MAHNIAALERKLQAIGKSLGAITESQFPRELLTIIRQPGFTTVPEAMLIETMLVQMQRQIETLHRSCDGLLAAARKIVE